MSDANAVLLIPLDITDDMIAAGTSVPVVDSEAGEVAWVAATPYAIDAEVNHIGSIWLAVATSTGAEPSLDSIKWLRRGPSNRMAAFDSQLDTVTRRPGNITFVLRPGFFTGVGLWGLVGDHLNVKIYDEPGGVIVEEFDDDLFEQAMGLYELLFMPLQRRTQVYMQNVPLYPDAEVRITLTTGEDTQAEIALISVGHWDTLVGSGDFGGAEYGAQAEIKSYSYLKRNDDGSVTRVRRGSANNVECSVVLPMDQANHAMEMLHQVQGRPVAFIASGLPRYEFLSGFGDVSGGIVAETHGVARLSLKIEGAVQGARN